jgi:hypothetical protein
VRHIRQVRQTTLQLRPYRTVGGKLQPALLPAGTNWRVIVSRTGAKKTIAVGVSRDPENPYVWTGSFRVGARGAWTLRIVGDRKDSLRVDVAPRSAARTMWDSLDRPFRIPTIRPGTSCPTSTPDPSGDLTRLGNPGAVAWGTGPAYPLGFSSSVSTTRPVLEYNDPLDRASGFFGSRWSGQKVLWFFDRSAYQGPILIRGRQLDGMNILRFGDQVVPEREMRVRTEQRVAPTYARIRLGTGGGCYAFQVDGTSFTSLIIFDTIPTAAS